MKRSIKNSFTEDGIESILSVKNMIINLLKEENLKFQNKVKKLENQLLELDQKNNSLDQYTRSNNLEIQGIVAKVADEKLDEKVIDIFSFRGIEVEAVE